MTLAVVSLGGLVDRPEQAENGNRPAGWLARVQSAIGFHTGSQSLLAQNDVRRSGGSAALSKIPSEVGQGAQSPQGAKAGGDSLSVPRGKGPSELRGIKPVKTRPLRDMALINPSQAPSHAHAEPVRPPDLVNTGSPSGFVQNFLGPILSAPTATGVSWDGVGVGLAGFSPSSNPPDVNGRVGGTQYVQWNNTSFAVFDKNTGALLLGPTAGNTLFQSLGGLCASHNDGDPVVSYDIMAGRWILSQFVVQGPVGSASHQCVAISQTADATGAWYTYDFLTDGTNFVDYPHMGVWPDSYYMTGHIFNAAGTSVLAARVYAFERAAMLAGGTARMQSVNMAADPGIATGGLPADVESFTPPPAGAQEYVIAPNGSTTNRTDLYRIATTWGASPTMVLSAETVNTTVGLGTPTCVSNSNGRDCVPQIGAGGGANVPTDDLDSISRHYMHRLAYHNNGGTESLLVTGPTTGAVTTPRHGAVKWIEWRGAAGSSPPTLFQSGTYDPTPTTSDYRWVPSIAMDNVGNIALGYSKSSNTTRASIWITGRLVSDTINTMGAEALVQAGAGTQTAGAGNRWGDYTSMTLDPIDQCTFYYTNEYLKADGTFNWSTRISLYSFPTCSSVATTNYGTITGTITSTETGAPVSGVTVTLTTANLVGNGYAGATDVNGVYTILAPVGAYTATPTDPTRNCATATPASAPVTSTGGGTFTQNFTIVGTSKLEANGAAAIDDTTGNSNGVVNSNECIKVNLPIKNNGCAKETAISATLTSSTAGVSIISGNATYPDLLIDGSAINSIPFHFSTSNSFACGTDIVLTLNLTYASGTKSISYTVGSCAGGPNQTIPTHTLSATDNTGIITDRLGRTGIVSTCASPKAYPGTIGGTAANRYYETFTFTNNSPTARCYTITINAALGGAQDIMSVAYDTAFVPLSQGTNYLGDSGISGLGTTVGSVTYSVIVPGGHNFVVLVNDASNLTASSAFSGVISGFVDTTAGPGPCPPGPPPNLTAAASRMTQGAGTFSRSLPLGGSGIEVRDGGGSYTIVLTFDSPINGGSASMSGTGSVSNVSFSGNNMIISLSGVTDQQAVTVTATNVTGTNGGVLPSASVGLGFLIGDVNGDRVVNVGDTTQVRNAAGQPLTSSNYQFDLNADGQIDVGDAIVVRSKSGDFLP
jgi:Dockerin type I domain